MESPFEKLTKGIFVRELFPGVIEPAFNNAYAYMRDTVLNYHMSNGKRILFALTPANYRRAKDLWFWFKLPPKSYIYPESVRLVLEKKTPALILKALEDTWHFSLNTPQPEKSVWLEFATRCLYAAVAYKVLREEKRIPALTEQEVEQLRQLANK